MATLLLIAIAAALASGAVAALAGAQGLADALWAGAVVVMLVPLGRDVGRSLLRRQTGVDVIALLAMAGALALGEYLAGAVIAVMLAGGRYLELSAEHRATRELSALLVRAPRSANRLLSGDRIETVDIDEVAVGDRLLVRPGEVIPVDGVVVSTLAVLDTSALTGESRPVERSTGERVPSGVVNAGGPFQLRAASIARDSVYAGIVRLVEEAQHSRAPFVRLADRYAGVFLPVTLAVAGGAWLLSGDPVRALAVLVVATPCPLILAAPIAITSGLSRAARRGIIVKGGAALEGLARSRVVLFDKTGTLTASRPRLAAVEVLGGFDPDELLRLAASLDQASAHVFAGSIVGAARDRDLALDFPHDVSEAPGAGLAGTVGTRQVRLGKAEYVLDGPLDAPARTVRRRAALEGSSPVFVAVDGKVAGALLLDDPLRPEAARVVSDLRRSGIAHVAMVTGDAADIAELVGRAVDVDQVLAERTPADKVEAVQALRDRGPTLMVGDGINDAPALAVADVGVAMGAQGATASADTADVVLVVDRLDRLTEARAIAARSRAIAVQSVVAGIGLSFVAMGFAAAGLLAPIAGALVQEAIDLLVIANALRARGGRRVPRGVREAGAASARFRAEHRDLVPEIDRIRLTADRLDAQEAAAAREDLARVRTFLNERLLPHELAEERAVYPMIAAATGDHDPTGPLAGAHREIVRLVHLLDRLIGEVAVDGPTPEDCRELRRNLYGLHAILRLHFAQEEDAYLAVDTDGSSFAIPTSHPVHQEGT